MGRYGAVISRSKEGAIEADGDMCRRRDANMN